MPYNGELLFGTPRKINQLLANQEIDIGMISSLSYIDHRSERVLLSDVGIASTQSVQSVSLFLPKGTNPNLLDEIYVSDESETSVRLLRVLCTHFWKIYPRFIRSSEPCNNLILQKKSFLSIGDSCLHLLHTEEYTIIDLATAWHMASGKGFIFALLATLNQSLKKKSTEVFDFHYAIHRAFQWSQENLDEIIACAHERIPTLSSDFFLHYYTKSLEYRLSSNHFQGLDHFSYMEQQQEVVL